MVIFLVLLLVVTTAWGQYWYDKAHRQADAIAFMIEQEVDEQ